MYSVLKDLVKGFVTLIIYKVLGSYCMFVGLSVFVPK